MLHIIEEFGGVLLLVMFLALVSYVAWETRGYLRARRSRQRGESWMIY